MKVKTLASAIIAVGFAATSAVGFADEGSGKITFKGSIIDAPCSIAPASQNQEIDMGQIANSSLAGGNKSSPTPFTIELLGCAISTKKTVTAKFTGIESSQTGLLEIKGANGSSGAALAIADNAGELIRLGQDSPVARLSNGDETLRFTAYLQGAPNAGGVDEDGKPIDADAIGLGAFDAAATFALTYN